MNVVRAVSVGSVWEIDLSQMRYRRYPREERPREMDEWSDARAGWLQDFVWHPIDGQPFVDMEHRFGPRLIIPICEERATVDGRAKKVTAQLELDEAQRVAMALAC